MAITTNPNLERHGADAIHIRQENGEYKLYIGEAKTYNQKKGNFVTALVSGIEDVIKHYDNHRKELDLYTYEDFLPPELEEKARAYQAGTLQLEVHLVCIVTYDCKAEIKGDSRDKILESVIENLRQATVKAKSNPIFSKVPAALMPRLNYILFPVIRIMTEVLNLRQQRKAKERAEKEKKAAQNRHIHGRSKVEKQQDAQKAERASRHLDGHKREKDEE